MYVVFVTLIRDFLVPNLVSLMYMIYEVVEQQWCSLIFNYTEEGGGVMQPLKVNSFFRQYK